MQRIPHGLKTVATPALVLDVPKMMRNIARLDAQAGSLGVTLRPHLKTVKSTRIAQCLSGGVSAPITVSTLAEAEAFHAAGHTDILYAVGIAPQKLQRAQLAGTGGLARCDDPRGRKLYRARGRCPCQVRRA